MIDREIKIPKVFQELHGEKPYLSTLILVYLAGIGAASIVIAIILPEGLPTWKIIFVFILYFDIGGGVVANLSTSTNQHYQGKTRLRVGLFLLHIIHPALLNTYISICLGLFFLCWLNYSLRVTIGKDLQGF